MVLANLAKLVRTPVHGHQRELVIMPALEAMASTGQRCVTVCANWTGGRVRSVDQGRESRLGPDRPLRGVSKVETDPLETPNPSRGDASVGYTLMRH